MATNEWEKIEKSKNKTEKKNNKLYQLEVSQNQFHNLIQFIYIARINPIYITHCVIGGVKYDCCFKNLSSRMRHVLLIGSVMELGALECWNRFKFQCFSKRDWAFSNIRFLKFKNFENCLPSNLWTSITEEFIINFLHTDKPFIVMWLHWKVNIVKLDICF